MKVLNSSVAIYAIASILIILHLLQTLSSILIAKYDNLLNKPLEAEGRTQKRILFGTFRNVLSRSRIALVPTQSCIFGTHLCALCRNRAMY
jgi:hypothetical protein